MEDNMIALLPGTWEAKWIDPELPHETEEKQPASVLRRTFTLGEAACVRLFITCHGLYMARINGKRVGDFVLAPGTGDYRKRLAVQCYDVTALVHPGENEITVILGDGWYRGSVGVDGLWNYYGSDLALLCQMEADEKTVLISDETWQASQSGPIRQNDLQQGETYDARMEEVTSWHGVTEKDYGYANLAATESVPVVEQETFPGRLITTPNGETVIDFGQNLAGYTQLCLTAKAGQKITLRHGETLDENGNFTQANFDPGARSKHGGIHQKIEYICKDGENKYKPSFCIFGFRYAKVETDADLTKAQFTAIAVYSRMRQTAFFECGSRDVNRLFENSLWSMRSNFCDVPTDCPTRERAAWTGDAQVFAPTGVMLMDCIPVLRKWLGECRLAQGEDGLVQNIAPVNNTGSMISNMLQGSSGWADACVIVPWTMYELTGDTAILKENYDMIKHYLAFVGRRARKTRLWNQRNPHKQYLVDHGFHFGEWCEPDVDNMDTMKQTMIKGAPEVATAYYYRSASLAARMAEILGKGTDAKHFAEVAQKAREAYRFTCTDHGKIHSDRQCAYVRPLAFGLLDGDEAQTAADDLNALVIKNGYHLNTGFLSTPDLCPVLTAFGHQDTAYRLLLQETRPGWLYAVKKGATTIWETWDGVREDGTVHDSLNHYSYGAVSGWLLKGVAGICYRFDHLMLSPHPDRSLGYAKASFHSPAGLIESAWAYEGDRIIYDFTVPEGLKAEIILPDGRKLACDRTRIHLEEKA